MDFYFEESVAKKDLRANKIVYNICIALTVVFGLAAAIFLSLLDVLIAIPLIAIAFVFFFLKDRQFIEYDYTLNNGEFIVAKITNNKKRKVILTLMLENINHFAETDDKNFQHAKESSRVIKAYLNMDEKHYYAVFNQDNVKYMLIFEPSEEMVSNINKQKQMGRGTR